MLAGKCLIILIIVATRDRLLVNGQVAVGSPCNLSRQSGVCRLLNQCQPVLNALISGKRPEVVCGYQGTMPIVCCPTNGPATPITTTPSRPDWGITQPTTRPSAPTVNPHANSRPARRMCAEYAKAVYALEQPPTLVNDAQLVNVSLCAIKSKKLIIGGTRAEPKEFPHMAVVGYIIDGSLQWKCGGSLISDRHILTAAHCVVTNFGRAKRVRVGDLNLLTINDDAKPQEREIVQWISHPNYKNPAKYNDIGILTMDRPVEFTAYVRPVCLSLNPTTPAGEKAVATGWGTVDFLDDEGSNDLLKVTLPIQSYTQCRNQYKASSQLPNSINDNIQYCAGQENKDTCQGDSGGPLVVYSTDEECMYDIIGVTSFGSYCGTVAGVFTRVYSYLSWIEGIVWPNLQ